MVSKSKPSDIVRNPPLDEVRRGGSNKHKSLTQEITVQSTLTRRLPTVSHFEAAHFAWVDQTSGRI